jgi:hypothetical protein
LADQEFWSILSGCPIEQSTVPPYFFPEPMKQFIFRFLFVIAATAAIGTTTTKAAQAQPATASTIPSWLQPYQQQFWNPQGILTLAVLGVGGYFILGGDSNKQGRMANARWAGGVEKRAARKVAIRQINERRRDGLTTWINTPVIHTLKKPVERQSKIVKRYNISPQANTIFIPDGQRGTMVCGVRLSR